MKAGPTSPSRMRTTPERRPRRLPPMTPRLRGPDLRGPSASRRSRSSFRAAAVTKERPLSPGAVARQGLCHAPAVNSLLALVVDAAQRVAVVARGRAADTEVAAERVAGPGRLRVEAGAVRRRRAATALREAREAEAGGAKIRVGALARGADLGDAARPAGAAAIVVAAVLPDLAGGRADALAAGAERVAAAGAAGAAAAIATALLAGADRGAARTAGADRVGAAGAAKPPQLSLPHPLPVHRGHTRRLRRSTPRRPGSSRRSRRSHCCRTACWCSPVRSTSRRCRPCRCRGSRRRCRSSRRRSACRRSRVRRRRSDCPCKSRRSNRRWPRRNRLSGCRILRCIHWGTCRSCSCPAGTCIPCWQSAPGP
jgi:hypothetical protein